MSCYSQGDLYSSFSTMTFPKPSASWSVALTSCSQSSEGNKVGWQHLWMSQTEMEMAAVPQQGNFLGVHTMQRSWPTLPGRRRRGHCLLLNPEIHPGHRSIALACWAWGGSQSERGAGLGGVSSASFGRQPQQKGSPVAWRMVPVSKLSMCLQDVISILKLLAENFPFNPPSSHSLQLSILWPKQICKKIIFVTSSLFLMKWLNVQEMKLLGAGVLME